MGAKLDATWFLLQQLQMLCICERVSKDAIVHGYDVPAVLPRFRISSTTSGSNEEQHLRDELPARDMRALRSLRQSSINGCLDDCRKAEARSFAVHTSILIAFVV